MSFALLTAAPQKETIYTTRQGDVVDAISFAHYGEENSELVNGIFKRNRPLCLQSAVLPAGLRIVLPVRVKKPEAVKVVSIWIKPSNVATLAAKAATTTEETPVTPQPTQDEIDAFLVEFRQLKSEGKIEVPTSPVFIPSYYQSGEGGINDPYIPMNDPVLQML